MHDGTLGANCPQTSGTVPKTTALSLSPQRGTDLSPNTDSEKGFSIIGKIHTTLIFFDDNEIQLLAVLL